MGHSTGDRVTNIDRPVVKFTAGEPALYIDIEFDSGDTSVSPVRIDKSKFSLDPLISIHFNLFTQEVQVPLRVLVFKF